MDRPPEVPDVGECPEDVESKILEATNEIEYGPEFVNEITLFVRENAKPLFVGQTSFFLLGSYDDYPIRRLQFAETQLNSRVRTYAFLLCDLLDPERFESEGTDGRVSEANTSRASEANTSRDDDTARDSLKTHCKFYLLSTYADYLVPIFEGRHAGPSVELGEIRNNFFEKTHAFRRDYDELDETELRNGVDPDDPYSQPQEALLSLFDDDGRLYEWADREDLARAVDTLPKR